MGGKLSLAKVQQSGEIVDSLKVSFLELRCLSFGIVCILRSEGHDCSIEFNALVCFNEKLVAYKAKDSVVSRVRGRFEATLVHLLEEATAFEAVALVPGE